jgi:methionyl aminopeptidase
MGGSGCRHAAHRPDLQGHAAVHVLHQRISTEVNHDRWRPAELATYKAAQDIARAVLAEITRYIVPDATEQTLHQACHRLMLAHGASGYWGNTPAFVLAGDRLRDSVFDHRYVPARVRLGEDEMITIDVGPRIGDCFGDCARSYFLKGGKVGDGG